MGSWCGSGGSNTTTNVTNNTPPPEVMEAFRQIMARSQQTADIPYQAYPGQTYADAWAGFLPESVSRAHQMAAPITGQLSDVANANMNPFAAQAAEYGTNFAKLGPQTQAFSPEAIQQYMSPYAQNVIDATLKNIGRSNDIQQQGVVGNAIKSGNAFGGDRMGVAMAELARNQDLSRDQTIAGLENQNYAQALAEFNANNSQATTNAGLGLGGLNLGAQGFGQAQQLGLTSLSNDAARAGQAGQQIAGLGQITQSNTQASLDAPYQQWLAEKAYPFATGQYLANNVLGTGSAMGGTSTSTSTQPKPAFSFLARGGRIPHRANGGGIESGVPWINIKQLPMGKGLPNAQAPKFPEPTKMGVGDSIAAARGANDLYKWGSDKFGGSGIAPNMDASGNLLPDMGAASFDTAGFAGLGGAGEAAGLGAAGAEMGLGAGLGAEIGLAGEGLAAALPALLAFMNRGGAVRSRPRRFADGGLALPMMAPPSAPPADENGMGSLMKQVEQATSAFKAMRHRAQGGLVMPSMRPMGFADGGDVLEMSPDEYNYIDAMADNVPLPRPKPWMPSNVSDDSSPNWQVTRAFQDLQAGDGPTFATPSASVAPTTTAGLNIPMPPLFARMGQDAPPSMAMNYDGEPATCRGLALPPPAAAPQGGGLNAVTEPQPMSYGAGRKPNGLDEFMDSPWLALAAGVLGAMASRSPHASVAIGEGALTGLSTYAAARKMSTDADKIRAQLQRQDLQQQEQVRHNRATEGYHDRSLTETTAQRRDAAEDRSRDRRDNLSSKGQAGKGVDPETGATVDGWYQFNPDTRKYDFQPGSVRTSIAGGPKEGQTERIMKDLMAENPNLTKAEALALTKRAPNGDTTMLRRESLALSAAKADIGYISDPSATLEKWRKQYGLGATVTPDAAPAGGGASLKPAPQATIDAAKAAIAKGAPKDAVIKRLRDAGFDTKGL